MKEDKRQKKRIIINGKTMIRVLAADPGTVFPVELNLLDEKGGASHLIYNSEELISYIHSKWLRDMNVIRVYKDRKTGRHCVDMQLMAYISVNKDFMPEISGWSILNFTDTKKYFHLAV